MLLLRSASPSASLCSQVLKLPYRTWEVVHPRGIGVRSGHTEVTPGVSRLVRSELVSCLLRPERGAIPCANLLSLLLLFIFTSNFILFVSVLMALALTQAGLDILGWSDSPASVFRLSGATRVHHYTLLSFCVYKWVGRHVDTHVDTRAIYFFLRFKLFYYLMCRIVFAWMYICVSHAHSAPRVQKRLLRALGLELQTVWATR